MKQANSFWYLENINLKDVFCPNKLSAQEAHLPSLEVKKGSYIFLENDSADKLFLILNGQVKIGTNAENGKEIIKSILKEGEVFGELALVGINKHKDYALAVKDTKICSLSLEDAKGLMRDYVPLNIYFMNVIGARAIDMERRLEALIFKDSRTRIIEFLHDLGRTKGKPVGFETLVNGFMTHQEIANLTATSRQTVTTILNELRADNIITFNRRRLLIRDLDKLGAAKHVA